jgi:tetratricopeptide (TPR) repeat protein
MLDPSSFSAPPLGATDEAPGDLLVEAMPPPSIAIENANVEFSRGQLLLKEGSLASAAKIFADLLELAEETDRDPAPYLMNLGQMAIFRQDLEDAKRYFERAIHESTDRNQTLDLILETPGIGELFTRLELVRLRSTEEEACTRSPS